MPARRSTETRPLTSREVSPEEGMKRLDSMIDAREKLTGINQRTMVIPAPAGFKPEPVAKKIRLKLTLEKSKIQAGEEPRFRLELTNVGRDPINYREYESSVFKGGSFGYSMRTMSLYRIDRKGARLELLPAWGGGKPGPVEYHAARPDSEKELLETNAKSEASTTFSVRLLPGDTLRSLGDGDSAQVPFRTLRVEGGFKQAGTYKLQVELDDRPSPLDDGDIKFKLRFRSLDEINKRHAEQMRAAIGPATSNAVTLEVVR